MGWNIATAVLALTAGIVNAWVGAHLWRAAPGGTNQWAIWHCVVAGGGFFYAAMFVRLVLDADLDRADWSVQLVPASAVTFFAVWTVPALIHALTRPAADDES